MTHIVPYFIDLQINLKDDNGNVFTTREQQSNHIRDKLAQNTADINAIIGCLTGELMVDPNELDDSSVVTGAPSASPESSQQSDASSASSATPAAAPASPTLSRTRSALSRTRSASSMSSMSSRVSQGSRMRKNCNKLKKLITTNKDIQDAIAANNSFGNELAYYLCVYPYDSCSSGSAYSSTSGSQRDSLSSQVLSQGGGSLPMKRAIKKSITTRKNKNKNRTKSKAPFRRGTFRIKRMIKSKLTRNKTCKRRAPNVKHKNNKTMRRYRRVRK